LAAHVEGQTVAIEYRWAEDHADRLPALAAELVRRQVAVIVTSGNAPAQAAKAATLEIAIVFLYGGEPVSGGLVASLNRPGGNVTGVTFISTALVPKRLELLNELVPKASVIAALVNPDSSESDLQLRELQEVGGAIKHQIHIVSARTEGDVDIAFATLVQRHADALLVANDPFFNSSRAQIVALAARHAIPACYSGREFVEAGGLVSYGASLADAWRLAGSYAGKILKGAKPADLPVLQPTKLELVINLKAAAALGIVVPNTLLAAADDVIE
jgi:putative tryptophan/tyrosine transport system substrate-binding protein